MSIFNLISLFGGLALFLYGMRTMSTSLKEGSSGTLKKAMESVTNNPVKAFVLGIAVTAIIQSSTATIVITSGLVAAGIITLRQSLGIIIGANVGTTVTGQIIRLLDLNSTSTEWLQFFKPSTLAPIALIIGIIFIMFCKFKNSDNIGTIAMGFGILFTGLLNMTNAVSSLSDSGVFDPIFSSLGRSPLIGYLSGAGVAFILQSSSATIGILQAFSSTGQLTFKAIYAVLVGIYLGDCVTTAIVCSIGAKSEAKKVGIVNILFNLSETVLVLVSVTVIHKLGLLDSIWNKPLTSGGIANSNTIFNLGCAILLFPMINVYEKLANKIVKSDPKPEDKYADKIESLNPVFINTPAIALNSCFDVLLTTFNISRANIENAFSLIENYDQKIFDQVVEEEDNSDRLTDAVSNYLVTLSPKLTSAYHVQIMDQYYKNVTEFERLSDHALNIAETAQHKYEDNIEFSEAAKKELSTLHTLISQILEYSDRAFRDRDIEAARHIEPCEQVTDDLVNVIRDNHLTRLREGVCTVNTGTLFMNLLTDIERISDVCSNIAVATIARAYPDLASQAHEYISSLQDTEEFKKEYSYQHKKYFDILTDK